ncbi:hypothetical protein ACLI4Z_17390 [Natrialbaceae archaeon A-arb3/5]
MDDGTAAALFAFVLGLPMVLLSAFFASFTAAFATLVLVGCLALSFVVASWVSDANEATDATAESTTDRETDRQDDEAGALDVLRERYARGELSEAAFERKTEQLLRTETVDDAVDYVDDEQPRDGRPSVESGRDQGRDERSNHDRSERDYDLERER